MEEIVDLMFTRRYAECKGNCHAVAPAAALIKTGKYRLSKWTLKLRGYKGKSTIRRATRGAGQWMHPQEQGSWTCVLLP
jgi:hypothetical protein